MIHVCGILNGIRSKDAVGEAERMTIEILAQWRHRPGVAVEIVTSDAGYAAFSSAYPRLIFRSPRQASALGPRMSLGRFDLVVTSTMTMGDILPALWLKATRRARRVALHVPEAFGKPGALLWLVGKCANFFWVDTQEAADALVARDVARSKIEYAHMEYLQVNAEPVADAPRRFDALYVGPRSLKHGTDLLLKAWHIVQYQLLDTHLILTGNDEPGFDSHAHIEHAGIQSSVSILDGMSDGQVVTLLARTRLFVMPNREESESQMLLEALASGVACVTFDVPAFRYAFPWGRLIATHPTPEALARRIVEVLDDASIAGTLISETKKHFRPRRWDNIADLLWSHAFRT